MTTVDANLPSESSRTVGGWFGDIMDGVKQPVVDALGWKIRERLGLETGAVRPTDATTTPPDIGRVGDPQQIAGVNVNTLLWVGGGITLAAVLAVLLIPRR